MRTSILLVSAFVFALACSKDAETTAPSSSIATVRGAASAQPEFPPGPGVTYPPGPGSTDPSGPTSSAKPGAAAALTTVSSSTFTHQFNGTTRDIIATCAAGVVVGGGHQFNYGAASAVVEYSGPFGTNAWRTRVTVPSGWQVSVTTIAMCIS